MYWCTVSKKPTLPNVARTERPFLMRPETKPVMAGRGLRRLVRTKIVFLEGFRDSGLEVRSVHRYSGSPYLHVYRYSNYLCMYLCIIYHLLPTQFLHMISHWGLGSSIIIIFQIMRKHQANMDTAEIQSCVAITNVLGSFKGPVVCNNNVWSTEIPTIYL